MRDPLKWLLMLLAFVAVDANTAPVAVADHEGIKVTLTDEKCTLKVVTNLPFRVTWQEKGKSYEGCFAPNSGIVVMFFDDGSVVVASGRAFRPLTSL